LKRRDGYKAFKAALTDVVDAVEIHSFSRRSFACLQFRFHVAKSEYTEPRFYRNASLLKPENKLSTFSQLDHGVGARAALIEQTVSRFQ
jgi:hypothetical protein